MEKPISRTVGNLLTEMCARAPEHQALVDGGRRWSYRELLADTERCSRALLAHDIRFSERVGILAGNRAEWLISHFAIASIGAICVGLNTWANARELAYQLKHADIKLLIVEPTVKDRDFIALVQEAEHLAELGRDLTLVVLDSNKPQPTSSTWSEFLATSESIGTQRLGIEQGKVQGEHIACMLYTSGSTALPKGVPLQHSGLIDNMWEIGERQHLKADDRLWLAVSLFWSLASVNALYALLTHGATVVLQHQFEAGKALEIIEKERCSVFYGTPNMVLALAEHCDLEKRDISCLRTGVTIGTPQQIRRVAELGIEEICNVYGLTETYGNSTVTDRYLALEKRVETVGKVLNGQEIQIIDPDSLTPLPTGTVGEVVMRGNVLSEYWQDPERTSEAFTADGWFRSGDRGMLDENGYLYFRGRLKEMIKTGGINVAPAEVEEILLTHPSVDLAFVTGIPDERLDETVAAVIILKAGATADESALQQQCRASLATYKTPRHFRFVTASDLPLTSTGKLQRNRLHELFIDD